MGELGAVRRYHYWSDRSINQIATDNDIPLSGRLHWGLSLSLPFIGQFQLGGDGQELRRNQVARKIETAVGLQAVEDFITPPPVSFAKGTGHMEIARTTVRYSSVNDGVVIHFTAKSSNGDRVAACLFGSIDNTPHYIRAASADKEGWTSSAWYAIEELLLSRGTENTSLWDNDEAIAVEALQIALHQGETGHTKDHKGKPWTRGFTIGSADDVEWFAIIYKDVELTKGRWCLDEDVDRILVGAPLWARTASPQHITLYHKDKNPKRHLRSLA